MMFCISHHIRGRLIFRRMQHRFPSSTVALTDKSTRYDDAVKC